MQTLAKDLRIGQMVRTCDADELACYNGTNRATYAYHRVAKLFINRDNMVEVELRDGPVLRHLLRLDPQSPVTIH